MFRAYVEIIIICHVYSCVKTHSQSNARSHTYIHTQLHGASASAMIVCVCVCVWVCPHHWVIMSLIIHLCYVLWENVVARCWSVMAQSNYKQQILCKLFFTTQTTTDDWWIIYWLISDMESQLHGAHWSMQNANKYVRTISLLDVSSNNCLLAGEQKQRLSSSSPSYFSGGN